MLNLISFSSSEQNQQKMKMLILDVVDMNEHQTRKVIKKFI